MSAAATLVGCNKSAVSRHMRNCVTARIREQVKPEPVRVEDLNVVNQLKDSHKTTLGILQDSLSEGDKRMALKALEVELRQLELNAKLTGQLDEAPRVNFLLSPEYLTLKQVIIKALEPFPEARQRAARAIVEAGASKVSEAKHSEDRSQR